MRAIAVGVQRHNDELEHIQSDLNELESLLKTLGFEVPVRFIQKRLKVSASHLLGKGKIEEIHQAALDNDCQWIVIDHTLTPPQVRNIEQMTCCRVFDRAGVILEIFARHAKSNQAKTQVEIAQLEYLLPRLSGAWTHFQRQSGGSVRARGMGEKQIEVDRRRARERISRLQKRLVSISKERHIQRKMRTNELKVSLVGYTNSGKTSIMKGLTQATVEGRDALFATLDASTRVIDPATRPKILLSDTVGFIRNLPHSLVESFKSTLEEVLAADLLLHVVDLSHPNYRAQMEATDEVLKEIGAADIPTLVVYNKMDIVDDAFLGRILTKSDPSSIAVSSFSLPDMLKLRNHIYDFFEERFHQALLRIPASDQSAMSLVHRSCLVNEEQYDEEGLATFKVRAPKYVIDKLKKYNVSVDTL